MSKFILSSTIFTNGGTHRVNTNDRTHWGKSSPPGTKDEEMPRCCFGTAKN